MIKSGICNLPLHSGCCPRWLFPRMKKLAGAISEVLIFEYGNKEFLRSLALISNLVYGAEINWKDPMKYSFGGEKLSNSVTKFAFALGGKDGVPYRIDKKHYDETIEIMRTTIKDAKLGDKEKLGAIKRLRNLY